ncbi:MAG TPA: hypothetical protein PK765_01575 [bacterium]|nr:hypothetical protein [bacterium]
MKKVIPLLLAALGSLFVFIGCTDQAQAIRMLQADRPVVYSTSTGIVRYWNGSALTQVATSGYGLSYHHGKFIWWNDALDRFDYVLPSSPTVIRTYSTPVSLGTGAIQSSSNAQWTDYGFAYVRQASTTSEFVFRSSVSPYPVSVFSRSQIIPGSPSSQFRLSNYRVGANGNLYFAFEYITAYAGPTPDDREHVVCEFVPRPFSLVSCVSTGYDGMAQLDTDEDGLYDATVYLGRQRNGSGTYYTDGTIKRISFPSDNSPVGRYFDFDVIDPDDIRLYNRFWPQTSTGAFVNLLVSTYSLNIFETSSEFSQVFLEYIPYCSYDDGGVCTAA